MFKREHRGRLRAAPPQQRLANPRRVVLPIRTMRVHRPMPEGRRQALAMAVAALAGITGAALPCRAAPQEWVITPHAGYAAARVQGRARHGAAAALEVDYGLNDSFGLRGTLHYQGLALPGADGTGLFSRTGLGVGASYVFDVLQVIPYVSLTVGAAALGGGDLPWRWNAEARLAVGLDWLVRRDFSAGLELAYGLLAPDLQRFPWALTVTLRFSYRRP